MDNLIFIVFLFLSCLLINAFFYFRQQQVLKHLIITNHYYEKLLLLKKVINFDDVAMTRRMIKNKVGYRNYCKIRKIFLEHDEDYAKQLSEINDVKRIDVFDWETFEDLIYHRDYIKAMKFLSENYQDIVKKHKKTRKKKTG